MSDEKKSTKSEILTGLQRHHLARLAMMMAEERGEVLEYEEALKL